MAHPVISHNEPLPFFRLFTDEDVLRLVGEVDYFALPALRRLLVAIPREPPLAVDLVEAEFVDSS